MHVMFDFICKEIYMWHLKLTELSTLKLFKLSF